MAKVKSLTGTREKVNKVVSEIEDFVCATMGPSGQTIALHNDVGVPVITKDGVTVAKAYEADEPTDQLIADIIKQAAEKTNEEAGDGTTTSIAITSMLVREGSKALLSNSNVNELRREVEEILKFVQEELHKQKVEFGTMSQEEIVQILYKISMISSNGDHEISSLISNAVAKAGKHGIINTTRGSDKYELNQAQGMKVGQASLVDYRFIMGIPDKKMILEKCWILLTTQELDNSQIINELNKSVLSQIIQANGSLLIVCKNSGKSFLANMINNNAKGNLKNGIVKTPYFGAVGREILDDLAAYVGATVVEENAKWANVQLMHLGYAETVEATPWHTYIINPKTNKDAMIKRIEMLEKRAKMINYKTNDADKTMERLAALTGASYTISIPATSDIEYKERMDRVEDALNACRGALECGYLPGGGLALYKIGEGLNSTNPYTGMVKSVIQYPFKRILQNAGEIPEVIAMQLKQLDPNFVYDARDRKFGKPLEIGVIDSFKVIEKSLLNGFSVGLMLLTTTGILADKPEQNINPYPLEY